MKATVPPQGGDSPGELQDVALLARFRAGDLSAFDQLYARHRAPVFGFLVRLLGDRTLADDVFQDLWLQVVERAGDFRADGNVRTWLFTLARSRALDRLRREAVRNGGARDPNARAGNANPDGGAHAYTFDGVSRAGSDVGADMAADAADLPDAECLRAERAALLRGALAQLPEEQRLVFLMREEGELSLPEAAAALGIPYETAKSRYRYALARLRDFFGLGAGARR